MDSNHFKAELSRYSVIRKQDYYKIPLKSNKEIKSNTLRTVSRAAPLPEIDSINEDDIWGKLGAAVTEVSNIQASKDFLKHFQAGIKKVESSLNMEDMEMLACLYFELQEEIARISHSDTAEVIMSPSPSILAPSDNFSMAPIGDCDVVDDGAAGITGHGSSQSVESSHCKTPSSPVLELSSATITEATYTTDDCAGNCADSVCSAEDISLSAETAPAVESTSCTPPQTIPAPNAKMQNLEQQNRPGQFAYVYIVFASCIVLVVAMILAGALSRQAS